MIHFLSGVRVEPGLLRAFPLCHPQLQLYDNDELTSDIQRVHCTQCRTAWTHQRAAERLFLQNEMKAAGYFTPSPPFDEWVAEGEGRIALELERARQARAVDRALEKREEEGPRA